VDTLIRNGTVVTCDSAGTTQKADVLLQDGKIAQIVTKGAHLHLSRPVRVVDADGAAVIPGLVQAHVHLCQTLMRGHADDLPLLDWLKKRIWPLEAAHTDQSLMASANLGILEMMLAGTTTILDMGTVHGQDAIMQACVTSGIRAFSGKAMMDAGVSVPARLRETTAHSLRESDRLASFWHGREQGRIGYAFAPRFVLSCTERLFRGLSERMVASASTTPPAHGQHLRESTRLLFHSHAAEHPVEQRTVRELLGADDVDVLRSWGFCGPQVVLAHGVQLSQGQMQRAAKEGTRFVHCPSANLKLGSGIAQVHAMQAAGMQLGLGADGAPCNNTMDPWVELRLAALLSKVQAGTTSLPAERAFRLATIEGAKALGIDDRTGSLEVGKQADLAIVRLDGVHAEPSDNVYSKLVYACRKEDVTDVFVDGEHLVQTGNHVRLDAQEVLATARAQSKKQLARAQL
jgi:5-methylthioadenosine/S-adenosylhomocysteine deaminase